jgi:hypothetical protein
MSADDYIIIKKTPISANHYIIIRIGIIISVDHYIIFETGITMSADHYIIIRTDM